jgi:hypothetical protein
MFIYPASSVKPDGIAANMTSIPRGIPAAPAGLPMAARDVLMQYGESRPGWRQKPTFLKKGRFPNNDILLS